MLNTSYELVKSGPNDGDEEAAHDSYQLTDKEVTMEEKHCHVQQWLDGMGADNMQDTGYLACETKPNQQFSCIIPLLQLLFAKGVLDEVRPHLPTSLQNEIDKLCYQSLTVPEDVNDTCNEKTAPCTHVNKKQDCMEELKDNTNNTINPTLNCQTTKEIIIAEKELVMGLNNTEPRQGQQDSNFNDNKSLFMDGSTNIMDAESRAADKHKIIKENSLIQCCIDSPPRLPRECQMMSEKEKEVEKNATKLNLTKHSTNLNPIGLAEEAICVHSFAHVPYLVPASSRDIHHATPCFHQGPKRLLKPVRFCLGCAPHPDGIILTSRNYLCSLQSDEHTCPFHRTLVDKHFNSPHQTSHHTVEFSNKIDTLTDHDSIYILTAADCNNSTELQLDKTLIDHDGTQLQFDKIETVPDHDSNQPLNQGLSRCNNESKGKHDNEASSLQVLQDITNAKVLSVFDYHTPTKQEPRPTQLINVKVSC